MSESFARRHWPGQDPIGKSVKRGRPDDPRPPYVVVGVAADVKGVADVTDGDVSGVWYLPYPQNPGFLTNDVTFVVHARVPPAALEASLHGIEATDPLSYAAAASVLGVAAGLASWLPARRAARVDPMVALRSE